MLPSTRNKRSRQPSLNAPHHWLKGSKRGITSSNSNHWFHGLLNDTFYRRFKQGSSVIMLPKLTWILYRSVESKTSIRETYFESQSLIWSGRQIKRSYPWFNYLGKNKMNFISKQGGGCIKKLSPHRWGTSSMANSSLYYVSNNDDNTDFEVILISV